MSKVGTCQGCGEEFVQKLERSAYWNKGIYCPVCAERERARLEAETRAYQKEMNDARRSVGLPERQ